MLCYSVEHDRTADITNWHRRSRMMLCASGVIFGLRKVGQSFEQWARAEKHTTLVRDRAMRDCMLSW